MPRWIVAFPLLLTLAVASPAAQPPAAAPSTVVATVNCEAIRLEEVDTIIAKRLAVAALPAPQLKQLRTEILADLIDDVLLRQFLREHGPKIDPAEIDKQLKALADSLAKRGKSLNDFYRETNQSEAQVRETWTTLLQLSAYVKQHVPDDQLKQYYLANKDAFDRVEVKVSHIMVRVGPKAQPVERAAAREKLQAVRADILAGRISFADAAKRYSQCPSAAEGGSLGFILRKGMLMDEAFCKAAFSMKPGELSGVVESEYGLHLILVVERKPGTPSTFEKSLDDVRDQFTDEFRIELVAKLRKQAQIQLSVP